MKIQLVCADWQSDQILARLAKTLVENIPEITPGKHPDPKADINYYFPYLLFERRLTPSIAWFTDAGAHGDAVVFAGRDRADEDVLT